MVSLDKVGALPDDTYGDILCDFTKCSNEGFKAVFQNLLTIMRELIICPQVPSMQPHPMALLLLNSLLTKSNKFSMMLMIYTTTLQPPTNGMYIAISRYVSTIVEIMVLIIAKNSKTKPAGSEQG